MRAKRRPPGRGALLAVLLCCAPVALAGCERGREPGEAAQAPGQAAAAPRSVLLISIDSLRADRLGCYGNPRAASPTLDRLAREGVLFERAMSVTSWTLPAHVTLLTGRLPHHHGTLAWFDSIPPSETLLQESFVRRGYETAGFYSGPLLHPYYGFARGFESYTSCQPQGVDDLDLILAARESHDARTNAAVEAAFGAWAARRSARPFFAFVHMWDVHFDYIPPEPYASMFDPDYRGALDGRAIGRKGFPPDASRRDVEHLLALYDGELRYTDDTIAALLAALERAGALDDTLVVVTADHGEEFHEHHGKTHSRTVYDESVHVPLIVWSRHGLPRGLRVGDFVSLADIAPTIADLAGLAALPDADGRSLVPALRGETLEPRPVLSALVVPGAVGRRTLAIREGERSLVLWKKDERWMEFDRVHDAAERRPKPIPEGPERAALERFDAEVLACLARRKSAGGAAGDGAAAAAGAGAPGGAPVAPGPPAAVTEQLRALGYIH